MLIKAKTTINGIEMELQDTMDWSTYDQMWVEIGIDAEGNKYELYYEDVEGQELEDYDYDNPVKIEKIEEDQEESKMTTKTSH